MLNGKFEATFQIGANSGQNLSITIGDMRSDALGVGTNYVADDSDGSTITYGPEAETATWQAAIAVGDDISGDGSVFATKASDAGYYNGAKLIVAADTQFVTDATGGIDVSSQSNADAAITTINNAIESVSSERSKLGASQNRLEHTINNLNTSSENLTAAESRIRDVDYAEAA